MAEVYVGATACPVVLHELDSGQDALTHWPEQTSKVIDVLKSTIGVVDIQVSFVRTKRTAGILKVF